MSASNDAFSHLLPPALTQETIINSSTNLPLDNDIDIFALGQPDAPPPQTPLFPSMGSKGDLWNPNVPLFSISNLEISSSKRGAFVAPLPPSKQLFPNPPPLSKKSKRKGKKKEKMDEDGEEDEDYKLEEGEEDDSEGDSSGGENEVEEPDHDEESEEEQTEEVEICGKSALNILKKFRGEIPESIEERMKILEENCQGTISTLNEASKQNPLMFVPPIFQRELVAIGSSIQTKFPVLLHWSRENLIAFCFGASINFLVRFSKICHSIFFFFFFFLKYFFSLS